VDAGLFDASGAHLAKMLKLIEYHVGTRPTVAAEIADIRSGQGYQDRASDLVRAAKLWDDWHDEIQDDKRNFDPGDGAQARSYAQAIVRALSASMSAGAADTTDMRNRAWSLLTSLYSDVIAAGEFLFRRSPADLEILVPLKQAVNPTKARPKTDGPEEPGPPPAPGPTPPPAKPTT